MAVLISKKYYFLALVFFDICVLLVSTLAQNTLISCNNTTSLIASGYYRCNGNGAENQCGAFVILRANSYFSSLSNLTYYLGLSRFVISEANGFSADTEFLSKDQTLLIPIQCKCNGGLFQAELTKTTIKGESFYGIVESLEGLTTCKAIKEKNPGVSSDNLADKISLRIPLRCACPSSINVSPETKFLLSYPVSEGDTISKLALKFNSTEEAIVYANNRSGSGGNFKPERLVPLSTLLIPLNGEPVLGALAKPSLDFPASSIPVTDSPHKKHKKSMWNAGFYIALSGVAFGLIIAIAAALVVIQWKRKKQVLSNKRDLELQQLNLSVRTTSDKKVSFEGSQDTLDGQIIDNKMLVETYTVEELRKATEDFNSSNLIEGSVFLGRLKGMDLTIKRTNSETISKIDLGLFHHTIHHHPNIMRLLGTCSSNEEGSDSYLVFDFAKNGSLKDWLHGGLAIKSQFIASCNCFLTWVQRVRICLDVAVALQYMHHIMNPSYVHRNVKSRNIFLDEEFNAKIGNFGMAKSSEDEKEEESQSYWTKAYLAPEYLQQGTVSPNTDIFAYGVVLLEVLSGKTPVITRSGDENEGGFWLSGKIKLILQSDNADELREWMDSALGEQYSFDAAVTLANLARACIEEDPSLRPSAAEIVEKLCKLVEEMPDGEPLLNCESSSKPLVMAAANTM